ncbi:MAG: hypothetical protein ABFR33_00680 [Verrucomicrobiota bacterium]
MNINIPDQIIKEFLSGVIAVLAAIAMGVLLSYILRPMAKKLPFTRLALVLALAPLTLINFLDFWASTILLIYSMTTALLGIAIDGITHLLQHKTAPETESAETEEDEAETDPNAIVWEKAE